MLPGRLPQVSPGRAMAGWDMKEATWLTRLCPSARSLKPRGDAEASSCSGEGQQLPSAAGDASGHPRTLLPLPRMREMDSYPLTRGSKRGRVGPLELDEPVAHAPLVLLQEDSPPLGQGTRDVERPQQSFAVFDHQRQDHRPQAECLLKQTPRWLVDETGELPDVVVGNPQAGEHHRGDHTFARAAGTVVPWEERTAAKQFPNNGPDRYRAAPLPWGCELQLVPVLPAGKRQTPNE
jgi:hypothetical protein